MEDNIITKIVLVEDDIDMGELVCTTLNTDGYKIHYQTTLIGIEEIIKAFNPSILILDVEIGEEDGIIAASKLLIEYPQLPILFISSHTDIESVTKGISTGGVGYLRKPFEIKELKAYIDRFSITNKKSSIVRIGSFTLNKSTRRLSNSISLTKQLTPLEYGVLNMLYDYKEEVVTYEQLSEKVWCKKYELTEASMNNVISKLRKIFENDASVSLQTLKNIGYKFLC